MTPAHERAVTFIALAAAAVPGIVAGLWSHIQNAAVLVGLFSSVSTGIVLLLVMLIKKIVRDREEKRQEREDKRAEELENRLRGISDQIGLIREMAQKALNQYPSLRELVQKMEKDLREDIADNRQEARRAHARLDVGTSTIGKLRAEVAAMGGANRYRQED